MSLDLDHARQPRAYHRHDPADLRAAILRAATTEFTGNGFGGARIDAIARRAGANKRMLYLYFGDKRELYEAVLEGLLADLRRAEAAIPEAPDPKEGMRLLIGVLARHVAACPELIRLLGRDARLPDPQSPALLRLATLLRAGVEQGVFHPDASPAKLYLSIIALAAAPAEVRADIPALILGYLRR
jgi:AcrR family transcriptional regulator